MQQVGKETTKVLLGMSGGTDSSVSALLLMEQGFEVIGITFRFWEEEGKENIHLQDAIELAAKLRIKHVVYDARKCFEDTVLQYFKSEYLSGRTPFPCAKCNPEVKWRLLFEEADRLKCSYVATGHYVGITAYESVSYLTTGIDGDKDQSFFLWGLKQEWLKRIIFPLGNWRKSEVRAYAALKGFDRISVKKDSLGVCFGYGDYRLFLKKMCTEMDPKIEQGDFIDENGTKIGRHQGYAMYTVGQRRNLGIYLNRAVYVNEILPAENKVRLVPKSFLYVSEFFLQEWVLQNRKDIDRELIVKVRYRKQQTIANVFITEDGLLKVVLSEPVEAIAPGQTAVFYRDNRLLGGGFIV